MATLTQRQIATLQAAGRNRVAARLQVLLGAGRIRASDLEAGMDLLRIADRQSSRKRARRRLEVQS